MSARPGGWVPGIGWVAVDRDVPPGTNYKIVNHDAGVLMKKATSPQMETGVLLQIVAWPDGTVPGPDADPVAVLAEIRRIAAEWDDRGSIWCMTRIRDLLAGGDHG